MVRANLHLAERVALSRLSLLTDITVGGREGWEKREVSIGY